MKKLAPLLKTNKAVQLCEIFLLFLIALIFIKFVLPAAGQNIVLKQGVVWLANIIMLIYVWSGLKLRGESWQDFGLTAGVKNFKEGWKAFLLTLLIFTLAMAGFLIGSIIMANITGIPQGSADMSGYDFLQENPGMLLLTLSGVWVASSFGEEVVYRAFLINRIAQIGLNSKTARIIAVVLSAIIFGLAHYEWGPMGVVQTTFMGLALGYCYLKFNRRLWLLVIAHAYMDTILMVQMYLG